MKKTYAFMLALILMMTTLLCGVSFAEEKRISIVTTIFPIYDWVREIVGDGNAEVTMLFDSGVDLHSYQTTAQDIVKINTSDVFIYVGGESDEWVEEVLATATNQNLVSINLVEAMGDAIKEEEVVEGMESEEEEEEESEEIEYDEHVWLSLRNAEKLVQVIASTMAEADPENRDSYQANAAAYIEKLAALDVKYAQAMEDAAYSTILFGDRFPFRYLVDDYGLNYYAAFTGCSAESEASFKTIVFLAQKVDELNLPAVLTIENPQFRIAETIVENTQAKNQKVLSLDSMQGTTATDVSDGISYLSVMESNLETLQTALN
ncbi:MAG: zinc ABC transporter substrate-binding protein [Clostridia bacterium]|nr:zinc ABC transporter substrate-binding protein [Clostridia bacterium]